MEGKDYKVVNKEGQEVGKIALNGDVFGAKFNEAVVHKVVRWQLAKRRAGTHSTLNKARMEGCGQKPWKQKGTGRARAGGADSPLWTGGAVAHGPTPRDYSFDINKKTRQNALRSVLSDKLNKNNLVIVDNLDLQEVKTKTVQGILSKVGVAGEMSLIVTAGKDDNLFRSSRNIPGVDLLPVAGVNVYDLMRHKYLIVTQDAVEGLQNRALGSCGSCKAE